MKRQPSPAKRLAARSAAVETLEARQLLSAVALPASLTNGTLLISGTDRGDVISLALSPKSQLSLIVTTNKTVQTFSTEQVKRISIYGWGGSDMITVNELYGKITANTRIVGANGNDTLTSGSGADYLLGGNGDDLLTGNGGNDSIQGDAGSDRILGGDGIDTLSGGIGVDYINSGAGRDLIQSPDSLDSVDVGLAGNTVLSKKVHWNPQPERGDNGAATPAANNSSVVGYTPDQIRAAYGFGRLSRKSFTNRGQGEVIAIVTAYDYRTAREDLNTFSNQFGLPEMGRKGLGVMYAGGVQPVVNALWASEAALDLQWAHAIAPNARLMLVEAASDLPVDMFNAIAKATKLVHSLGGGVVSMSFGFTEQQSDFQWETQFRNIATNDVSFVAAAGNVGGQVFYPAASEEVLAVGGTSLSLDANGVRTGAEAGWADSGGGESLYRELPDYQTQLLVGTSPVTNHRVVPDVAYNADPSSAYAVFNSTPNENGDTGWQAIGGTSAGAPQWAGLVALVNQKRVANGLEKLGNCQLNNYLYGVARKSQEGYFNDIITGSNGNLVQPGFDLVTGWGSPKADPLIDVLGVSTAKNRVSSRGRADFAWTATFTRSMLNGQLLGQAMTPFGGSSYKFAMDVGNASFSPTAVRLRFSQSAGEIADPFRGTVNLNAESLPRTGNTFEGTDLASVTLNDGSTGVFTIFFKGRLYRENGQDKVRGEFYTVDAQGNKLSQGATAILQGHFDSNISGA